MALGIIGPQFDGSAIMPNGCIELTFTSQRVAKISLCDCFAQIVTRFLHGGLDLQRGFVLRYRFVEISLLFVKQPEIVVGNVIVRSDGESLFPKRLAVFPIRSLMPRICR